MTWMQRFRLRAAEERGSLPMAMIAVIVVGGLTTAITADVVVGQQQARHDVVYESSLQAAEDGLERMVAQVEAGSQGASFTLPAYDVNGAEVEGSATRSSSGDWVFRAQGTDPDGVQRQVEMRMDMLGIFNFAAFGRVAIGLRGGNGADSYRSGTFDQATTPPGFAVSATGSAVCGDRMCNPTGNGVVGTNGALFLRGEDLANANYAEIHFANEVIPVDERLPGATGFCDGANTTCSTATETSCGLRGAGVNKLQYCAEPIELPEVVLPSTPTTAFDGTGTLGPGTHVFTNATLNSGTVITGTPSNPTIIYLTGQLNASGNVNWNTAANEPRPSPGLLIFSTSTGVAIQVGNHSNISAAIYAPNGSFDGNAQSGLYGSVVANDANTNGGFHVHYDDALSDVTDGADQQAASWIECEADPATFLGSTAVTCR